MIRFYCPACNGGIEAEEADYGHKVNCPHCKASVSVPAKEPPPRNPIASRFWWYDWGLRLLVLLGFFMMVGGLLFTVGSPAGTGDSAATVGAILFMGALITMGINGIRAKMEER